LLAIEPPPLLSKPSPGPISFIKPMKLALLMVFDHGRIKRDEPFRWGFI
jgi:hypothetical protein